MAESTGYEYRDGGHIRGSCEMTSGGMMQPCTWSLFGHCDEWGIRKLPFSADSENWICLAEVYAGVKVDEEVAVQRAADRGDALGKGSWGSGYSEIIARTLARVVADCYGAITAISRLGHEPPLNRETKTCRCRSRAFAASGHSPSGRPDPGVAIGSVLLRA